MEEKEVERFNKTFEIKGDKTAYLRSLCRRRIKDYEAQNKQP